MAIYNPAKLRKKLKSLKTIPIYRLDEIWQDTKRGKTSFAEKLLAENLISDKNLGEIIAEIISFPFIMLGKTSIPSEILSIIPKAVAKKQLIIAFKKDHDGLHLAMNDPANIQIKEFLAKKTELRINAYFATKANINNALDSYK